MTSRYAATSARAGRLVPAEPLDLLRAAPPVRDFRIAP